MFEKDEQLSDNREWFNTICQQCKDCYWRSDGTVHTSSYNKSRCVKYPYPSAFKPQGVVMNKEKCPHYRQDKD